jgi:hypothetical protein
LHDEDNDECQNEDNNDDSNDNKDKDNDKENDDDDDRNDYDYEEGGKDDDGHHNDDSDDGDDEGETKVEWMKYKKMTKAVEIPKSELCSLARKEGIPIESANDDAHFFNSICGGELKKKISDNVVKTFKSTHFMYTSLDNSVSISLVKVTGLLSMVTVGRHICLMHSLSQHM